MAYTVGVAAMLVAFWATPATLAWAQWASVFMIGFFLYGPQMLIGLCGAELVGPESVGASEVRRMLALLPCCIQCLCSCAWYHMLCGITCGGCACSFAGLLGLGRLPRRSQCRRASVNHREELRLERVSPRHDPADRAIDLHLHVVHHQTVFGCHVVICCYPSAPPRFGTC